MDACLRDVGRDGVCLLVLAASWVLASVLVNPVGQFPISDDWAYYGSVRALVMEGRIWFSDWGGMNLFSHVLWGALFAALFGLDYTVLRISTLVLTLLGHFALFGLLRLGQASRPVALLATLCSLFNPLTFMLAFSFMTDTTYAAMQMLAMWGIAWGALAGDRRAAALGWGWAVAAQLSRQWAVVIGVGAAVAGLLGKRLSLGRVVSAAALLVLLLLVQYAYQTLTKATGVAPRLYGYQIGQIAVQIAEKPGIWIKDVIKAPIFALLYVGMFLLPLTLATAPQWSRSLLAHRRAGEIAVAAAVLIGVAYVAVAPGDWRYPMWRNTLSRRSGLGPEHAGTPLSATASDIGTFLCGAGGFLLLLALAASAIAWWRSPRDQRFDVRVFGLVTALALLALVSVVTFRFDRYLIPVIPCVCVAIIPFAQGRQVSRAWLAAGFVLIAVMATFSTLSTHDYLSYKRVQAGAYAELRRTVPHEKINAGWSLNGLVSDNSDLNVTKLLTWRADADYAISVLPLPGYAVVKTYPIRRLAPWNQAGQPMLLQRRTSAPPGR